MVEIFVYFYLGMLALIGVLRALSWLAWQLADALPESRHGTQSDEERVPPQL